MLELYRGDQEARWPNIRTTVVRYSVTVAIMPRIMVEELLKQALQKRKFVTEGVSHGC